MQLRARARRCFLCRGSHAAPISDLHVSTFSYELDLLRGRGVLLPSLLGPTLIYYLATSCRCPPSALARSCSSFPLSADLSGVDLDTPLPLEIVRVRDCRVLGLHVSALGLSGWLVFRVSPCHRKVIVRGTL